MTLHVYNYNFGHLGYSSYISLRCGTTMNETVGEPRCYIHESWLQQTMLIGFHPHAAKLFHHTSKNIYNLGLIGSTPFQVILDLRHR